jgi:SAM-dependent methyltransferase
METDISVEEPFFEFWRTHIARPDDPHVARWEEYERSGVERAQARNEVIRSVVDLAGKEVLDVGCQNGAWLVALGLAGARATGIDVVPTAVEASRIRAACHGVDVTVEQGSACEMPFGTGTFDLVVSSDVIEHVPDKVAMIHECARVLRPGGYLYLAAPVRFSVKHLRSDPHYGHPVVSVLPGRAAAFVATRLMGEQEYEVETLPTRFWVERQLQRHNIELLPVDRGRKVPGPAVVQGVVDELRQGFVIMGRKRGG